MKRQKNNGYTPGQILPAPLQAIGRTVTLFDQSGAVRAGVVTRVLAEPDGGLLYDVQTLDGGHGKALRLGDYMNPQPGTFAFAY